MEILKIKPVTKSIMILILFINITTYAEVSKSESRDHFFNLSATGGIELYTFYRKENPYGESFSEIKTNVNPIYLSYYKIDCSIPFFFFKTLYKYKYSKNGVIDDDEKQFIKDTINNPSIQYLIDISSGLFGLEFDYLYQNFNNGIYKYYRTNIVPDDITVLENKERNIYSGKDYISISKKQFDIKYHFNWYDLPEYGGLQKSNSGIDFFVGYKFVNSRFPAIIYTTTFDDEMLVGESLPQMINTYYHMIGIGINNNSKSLKQGYNFLFGGIFYIGYSYMFCNVNDYWFLPTAFDAYYDPTKEKNQKIHMIPLNVNTSVNIIYCITNELITTLISFEWIFDWYYQFGYYTDSDYIHEAGNSPFEIFQSFQLSFKAKF